MAALLLCAAPTTAQSLSELSRQMEQKRSAAALERDVDEDLDANARK